MSELSELKARREDVSAKVREVEAEFSEARGRILEAIKNQNQRWYFFKDNEDVLFDRDTGLLWANLNKYKCGEGRRERFGEIGGFSGWRLPTNEEMKKLVKDKTFPFCSGSYYKIKDCCYWNTSTGRIDLDNLGTSSSTSNHTIPCSDCILTDYPTYVQDISPDSDGLT